MDTYTTPYTYHIAWTQLGQHYYGVRYANGCSPEDFWVRYFTSSETVRQYREQYGEPDVIEVRKTFDCPEKAMLWECKVLKRLKAAQSDKWLNKNNGYKDFVIGPGILAPHYGKKHSDETRQKMSEQRQKENNGFFGKQHSEEAKQRMSEAKKGKPGLKGKSAPHYGKQHSEETKRKISESQRGENSAWFGRKHSEETKAKLKEAWKKRKEQRLNNNITVI